MLFRSPIAKRRDILHKSVPWLMLNPPLGAIERTPEVGLTLAHVPAQLLGVTDQIRGTGQLIGDVVPDHNLPKDLKVGMADKGQEAKVVKGDPPLLKLGRTTRLPKMQIPST